MGYNVYFYCVKCLILDSVMSEQFNVQLFIVQFHWLQFMNVFIKQAKR